MYREKMYNRKGRERKTKTMASVLQDYFNTDLNARTLLDVGSSTGLIGWIVKHAFWLCPGYIWLLKKS